MLKRSFNNGAFSRLNPFKSPPLYSTSVHSKDPFTNPPMVEFLVKSVGFSEEAAAAISTKVSLTSKSPSKQPDQVLDFLKTSGFNPSQIRTLLTSVPELLRSDVAKTLEPKIRAFQDLGFRNSNLAIYLSRSPYVLTRSLTAFISPSLDLLKSLFDCDEDLRNLLLKSKLRNLLSSNLLTYLPANLRLLQTYGIPREKIRRLLQRRPLLFFQRPQWLANKVKSVQHKLGIPPTSTKFIHGVTAISNISENRLRSLRGAFRSFGWSETEISKLLKSHPFTVNLSVDLLRVKLKYFMQDLGYGSDYLAARSVLMSLSLEKRILPRMALIRALKEEELIDCSGDFYRLMCKGESEFLKVYVVPYKEKAPQVYRDYMQQTSRSQVGNSI